MAETRDTHVVEIPVDIENSQQNLIAESSTTTSSTNPPIQHHPLTLIAESSTTTGSTNPPIQHHPLTEISQSPGHLLLLRLYQREEDLLARRTARKESHLDAIKRDTFRLSSLFFAFHGLFLTLLFVASVATDTDNKACKNWWVPCFLSLLTSLVLVSSVQMRVCEYWKVWGQLHRERADARAIARGVQELRMKGASFDLSKEPPQASKRAKSSSVEGQWGPLRWCSRHLVTICLLCFTGLVVPAGKFILCG